MGRRCPAQRPGAPLILAAPDLHITFPGPMAGLVEDSGGDGAIRHQRQIRPGTDAINRDEAFHESTSCKRSDNWRGQSRAA